MSITPPPEPPDTAPTPFNERISIVRSLLGHRHPSEHLCRLIELAARGASWSEIHEADTAVRR